MNTAFRNILVVDDSANDYETYVRYLQKAGPRKYKTKCFSLGKEVFGAMADRPDCLLLDLSLPDMNGLDIISKLKAGNNQSLPFPVVMLTGSGDATTGEKAVRLGAQDYLLKEEITVESLSRAIEFAISRFALEQQLRASEERARHLATNMKMAADASGIHVAVVCRNVDVIALVQQHCEQPINKASCQPVSDPQRHILF